jgi:hypothetical protein
MAQSTQNHWACGVYPSSEIQYSYGTTFRQMDLFPSSGEERETLSLLDPLERLNLNHKQTNKQTNSVALSPHANYTD